MIPFLALEGPLCRVFSFPFWPRALISAPKSGPDAYAIKGNAVFCAKAAAASPVRKPPAAAFRRGRSEYGLNWVRQKTR